MNYHWRWAATGALLSFMSCLPAQHALAQGVLPQGVLPPAPRAGVQVLIAAGAGAIFLLGVVLVVWRARREQRQEESASEDAAPRFDLQSLPVPLALLDSGGRLLETNYAWQQLFGLDPASGEVLRLAQLIHPADVEQERQYFAELQSNLRQSYEAELRFYSHHDQALCGRLVVNALDPDRHRSDHVAGAQPLAVVRVEDMTRTQRAESELKAARAALHDLYTVVVGGQRELSERMRAMLEMGCRRFGVETGIVGRLHDGRFELVQVVSPDERLWRGQAHTLSTSESTDNSLPAPARVSVTENALQQLAAAGAQSAGDVAPQALQPHLVTERETYLGAPVLVDGRWYGLLSFASFEARPAPFTDGDLEMLRLMADWLGGEIERRQARRQLEIKGRQLEAQQQELLAANTRLEELATRDGLTGVYNRRFLDQRLDEEVARARRYKTPLSFVMLDVDKFKPYNDTYGHPAGDAVLKSVAALLEQSVRSIDLVARYGGEEFAVVLPNTDAAGARILAERLRSAIETAPWPERAITASFGIASLTETMRDRSALTSAADGALYLSKEGGRNRVTHAADAGDGQ